jgi:hypothetical protein
MVSYAEARDMALSFEEAAEEDHHGMASFRVRGKIFATVPDEAHLRVMLEPEMARAVAESDPACEELWWGKRLSGVTVTLAQIEREALAQLLEQAWRRRAPRTLVKAHDGG